MTGNPKVLHDVPADKLLRLKTHKLGRHYHKVPIFIKESSSKHPRIIADYFLRNFRITLELIQVNVHEDCPREPALRLCSPLGRIGFSIDRALLAEVLESYYGGTALAGELPPPNTSELRLGERLGKEVADLFGRMLLGGKSIGALERYENAYEEVHWEYVAEFRYQTPSGLQGSLFLFLDPDVVDELTSQVNDRPAPRQACDPVAQIKQLPLHLDCVLASLQMSLADVLALRPGDILMTRLREPVEVCINQHPLFRGSIFEESGSLFLTSLESVKNP